MIYSAVRDENWDTASFEIQDEVIEENESGFDIKYNAFFQLNQIRYKAAFHINGKDDTIVFSMKGVALNSIKTNRIGICVLHSVDACRAKKVVIKQSNGDRFESMFPTLISPWQPFKQVQEMQWTIEDRVEACMTFEGDVFETEDQRNWTDASYKTYSRPAELPFPYFVNEGDKIKQRITLKVSGVKDKNNQNYLAPSFSGEVKVPFPKIGYSRRKGFRHLTEVEINLFRRVPFDHYRVELHLDETTWPEELTNALSEARELATKLELVIFFNDDIVKELNGLIEKFQHEQQYISTLLVLHKNDAVTSARLLNHVYPILKRALPGVKIGYGTKGFFADLNRNRPQSSTYDFVSFSLSPQAHATDTRTILENLNAQADTIETAQAFTGGKPIRVSSVTLKIPGDSGKDIDPRQYTWFAAYWTLQTIKNLSDASITFYETIGSKGILKESAFLSPEVDKSAEVLYTPLYEALAAIKAFAPVSIIKPGSDIESRNTLVLENEAAERLIFIAEDLPVIEPV